MPNLSLENHAWTPNVCRIKAFVAFFGGFGLAILHTFGVQVCLKYPVLRKSRTFPSRCGCRKTLPGNLGCLKRAVAQVISIL